MIEPEIESAPWETEAERDAPLYLEQIQHLFDRSCFYREKLAEERRAGFWAEQEPDLFVGGLAENADTADGSMLGPTFSKIISEQFANLRAGDRLYFENQGFSPALMGQIQDTTLSDLILRDTNTTAIQADVASHGLIIPAAGPAGERQRPSAYGAAFEGPARSPTFSGQPGRSASAHACRRPSAGRHPV